MDARIGYDVAAGTGRIIDHVADVGGWPIRPRQDNESKVPPIRPTVVT